MLVYTRNGGWVWGGGGGVVWGGGGGGEGGGGNTSHLSHEINAPTLHISDDTHHDLHYRFLRKEKLVTAQTMTPLFDQSSTVWSVLSKQPPPGCSSSDERPVGLHSSS